MRLPARALVATSPARFPDRSLLGDGTLWADGRHSRLSASACSTLVHRTTLPNFASHPGWITRRARPGVLRNQLSAASSASALWLRVLNADYEGLRLPAPRFPLHESPDLTQSPSAFFVALLS